MNSSLQFLGIISVTLLAAGLTIVPIVWPYSLKHTFSQHVARHHSSTLYYNILFSIFLPLFLLFFIGWLVPYLHLPSFVVWCVMLVSVTQYACTFIPETTGWKRQWHRILAGSSAFGLIPIVTAFLFISNSSVQIIASFSIGIMLILPIIFLHPKFQKFGESYLIQATYYGAFFTPILMAAYL